MRVMPELETERLRIRPMEMGDETAVDHLLRAVEWVDPEQSAAEQLAVARRYVQWCSLNHAELARLYQPPYGDRVVILKSSGDVIGICGLVPYVALLSVFPTFGGRSDGPEQTALGMMWLIDPAHQRCGYATEVARALTDYTLHQLNLGYVIATTEYDNVASQIVMRKIGMRLERNETDAAPWLQVMGILEKP